MLVWNHEYTYENLKRMCFLIKVINFLYFNVQLLENVF